MLGAAEGKARALGSWLGTGACHRVGAPGDGLPRGGHAGRSDRTSLRGHLEEEGQGAGPGGTCKPRRGFDLNTCE